MLLATFALLLLGACSPQRPASAPLRDAPNVAEKVEDKSVAILSGDHAICGGVWLSPSEILTAFHCVRDAGKPETIDAFQSMLDALHLDVELPEWDPTGQEVQYSNKSGTVSHPYASYNAIVLRFDRENDLAILSTGLEDRVEAHTWAKVSGREIRDGDPVDVVGSTVGLPFTYLRGYVSATRPGDDVKPFKTLQLAVAGVNHGNSGGGAFDSHGDLVGIADFMIVHNGDEAQGIAFYTHRDVIAAFLLAAHG
jgi:hypothetical protein